MERNYSPDFDRVVMALNCKKPDRVPIAEVLVDKESKESFLGKPVDDAKTEVEFWETAGYDFIPVVTGLLGPGKIDRKSSVFEAVQRTLYPQDKDKDEAWAVEGKGVIMSIDDFNRFPWKESKDLDYSHFDEIEKYIPEKMKIIGVGGKIFTLVWILMGFENFCFNLVDNPKLIQLMFEKIGKIQLDAFHKSLSYSSVGAFWIVDDFAYHNSLMISPNVLREYLFPWYQEMINVCKKKDIPFIWHCCGNILEVLEDILEAGAHAIHPIEPKAMDIFKLKELVKGKLCLIGNLEVDKLVRSTPDLIRKETKHLLETLSEDGGYIIGSSNSIPKWMPNENYKAFLQACYDYCGKY